MRLLLIVRMLGCRCDTQPKKQGAIRRLGALGYLVAPASTRDCGRARLPEFGCVSAQGQQQTCSTRNPTSALPPRAGLERASRNVRNGHKRSLRPTCAERIGAFSASQLKGPMPPATPARPRLRETPRAAAAAPDAPLRAVRLTRRRARATAARNSKA